jgi:hypothetical protein
VGCYHPTAATNVPCASNGDCPGSQICNLDLPQPVCVDMLPDASEPDSAGGAPVGAACSRDTDCASTVCGETMAMCIDDAKTLFVAPTGDDLNDCSRASPCKTLSAAATKVDAGHTTIKVGMGSYTDSVLLMGGTDVLISGEQIGETGTDIMFDGGGHDHVVEARTTNVVIEGMAFHGGKSETLRSQSATLELHHVGVYDSSSGGIDCTGCTLAAYDAHIVGHTGIGIDARNSAAISVHRTRVSGNAGGGIRVTNASFDISSCFLVGDGSSTGLAAFAMVNNLALNPSRFAFNTVADNASGGVSCASTMTVSSSVFSDNNGPVTAMCDVTYSVFRFSAIPGNGNKMADPMFVDQQNGDYHIKAGSPAIDMGDPNETETTDIDDDMRPGGAKNDVGADEVP